MAESNNPLEELSELFAVHDGQAGPEGEELRYQLRFGEAELVLEDGRVCKVAINRAFLSISLIGLTLKPGSEYGAQLKENEVTVTHASKKDQKSSLKGGISAAIGAALSPSGEVSAGAEASVSKQTSEETSFTTKKTRVTPRAGHRWEIAEPNPERLEGDYLAHSVALCRVRARAGANQKEVTARVYVKQRDLVFRYEPNGTILLTRLSPNRQKLLNILIAKALNSHATVRNHQYSGAIVLSETVSEHEG